MPPTNDGQQAVNNVWASSAAASAAGAEPEFTTLPSGQTCWIRRIGIEGMIEAGLLSEGDSLMAIVDERHIKRARNNQGKNPKVQEMADEEMARSLMRDPKMLAKIIFFVDQTLPVVVVEPTVRSHFRILQPSNVPGELPDTEMIPGREREPDAVYTDQIGLEDKMFIFQMCVGGTRDIETFRAQSDAAVAGVVDGADVPRETKRPSRPRGKRAARR